MGNKRHEIEVEGRGMFPFDMLRYDRAQFHTPDDERVARNERGGLRYVTLICDDYPTPARWESFMWNIVQQVEVRR